MKRILIFSLSYYPYVSGAEIAIKEITGRISPEEVEFHMVTMRFSADDAREERIGNVMVYRVGCGGSYLSKILYVPRSVLLARKLHKRANFDALWAMMTYMTFPITLLRMVGVKLPYVLTLQDGDPFEHVFNRTHIRPFKFLLNSGFRNATVIQVISNYLATWVKEFGYRGSLEVIPNGVDVKKFSGSLIAHENIVLVHTGRLVYKNALDDVIRALVHLPSNIHFLLIGSGIEESRLKELAHRLGAQNRMKFMGNIPNDDLPKHLHTSDIFIRPSRTEGMGISFLEAMAAGIPIIATQEGGIADFLFDAKRNPDKAPTGFAVDKNSPQQIAEMVEYILANNAEVEKVVENAKKVIAEKYDWDLIAKEMKVKVFDKLLQNP